MRSFQLTLTDKQAHEIESAFADELEDRTSKARTRSTEHLSKAFAEKYSDLSLSEQVGLLLTTDARIDIELDPYE